MDAACAMETLVKIIMYEDEKRVDGLEEKRRGKKGRV
jgi:ribosome-associated protein YbcJ (S4-like RNA binding protein)